ncbi:MAG: hypothetical protein IJ930_01550 [Lachnospiraceae bacterium]|nr:hypothetical protein [Lachnospiraceae bacterium]
MMDTGNRDYKYYIDDLTKLCVGAKYTYSELLSDDNLSFRYRSIIRNVMLKAVDDDTSVESHIYYMTPDGADYACYCRLKTRVRYYRPEVKRTLTGKEEVKYTEHVARIQDLAAIPAEVKKEQGIIIHEIQMSKPALMIYVV